MKTRQEVPKPFALSVIALIVAALLIAIFSPQASAQTIKPKRMETSKAYHDRLQSANSWETYQNSYRKTMLSNAKETRKQKQEKQRIEKDRAKFLARLERIKGS